MAINPLDVLEFLGWFTGFWLFLFNRGFRHDKLEEWKDRSWLLRLLIPFEVAGSFLCGTAPLWVLWLALQRC